MGTVDTDFEHFLVDKVGLSEQSAASAGDIINWVGAASNVVGFLIKAKDFVDKWTGPSITIDDKLFALTTLILEKQDATQISLIVNDLLALKAKIDTAATTVGTYLHTPSTPNREAVKDNFDKLTDALNQLLYGKLNWFIPMVYGTPKWANGHLVSGAFYKYFHSYSFTQGGVYSHHDYAYIQVYKHLDPTVEDNESAPLTPLSAPFYGVGLPAPLSRTTPHWDGSLCLPLIPYGLAVWQAAMTILEPFYQLSGQWFTNIVDTRTKLREFLTEWHKALLWTREMPSAIQLESEGLFLGPAASNWLTVEEPSGFYRWPCGVLDPIMGVEIINPGWWAASQPPGTLHMVPELWTDDQRADFHKQRFLQLLRLHKETGFSSVQTIAANIEKLKAPPTTSPSLKVHPKLLKIKHLTSGAPSATQEPPIFVTDPGGMAWPAYVSRTSVKVEAPVSVQPNPEPTPGTFRAESAIVFGYKITMTPVGGQTRMIHDWPLRNNYKGQLSSLYHDANGKNLTIPYSKKYEFSEPATTWKTVTDGYNRERVDESPKPQDIKFSVIIKINDQELPQIPQDDFNLHGAIWIQIEADEKTNLGRSFEVAFEVTEKAAVDAQGYDQPNPSFSGHFKTYTQTMAMPVDICRVNVPTGYFGWLKRELGNLQNDAHRLGIPGPHPDPDPALELSLWQLVLEKNPALLQVYVRNLRHQTGRRSLTVEQALAQLSAAVTELRMG
jgi:hypothetical protein